MKIFILFWAILVFASLTWYGLLIFVIGIKGGKEIVRMTKTLDERNSDIKE